MIKMKLEIEGAEQTQKQFDAMKEKIPKALKRSVLQISHALAGLIVGGIQKQSPGGKKFAALAPSTIALKGSSKALINHGDLIGSVQVHPVQGGRGAFVGVHKKAKENGKSMANVAEIMEFGAKPHPIIVTPKMRAFFFAMSKKHPGEFSPISPKKMVIVHPGIKPRPFMVPSFTVWKQTASDQFQKILARELGFTGQG